MDTVFIERLWRSLKYEDVYLKGYADGRDAKAGSPLGLRLINPAASSGRMASRRLQPQLRRPQPTHALQQAVDGELNVARGLLREAGRETVINEPAFEADAALLRERQPRLRLQHVDGDAGAALHPLVLQVELPHDRPLAVAGQRHQPVLQDT
jgi:hypothetical protein